MAHSKDLISGHFLSLIENLCFLFLIFKQFGGINLILSLVAVTSVPPADTVHPNINVICANHCERPRTSYYDRL